MGGRVRVCDGGVGRVRVCDGVLPFLSLRDTHTEDPASHERLWIQTQDYNRGDVSTAVLPSGQRLSLNGIRLKECVCSTALGPCLLHSVV